MIVDSSKMYVASMQTRRRRWHPTRGRSHLRLRGKRASASGLPAAARDAPCGPPQPSRRRNRTPDSLESTESFGTKTNVRWLVWGDGVSAGVTQPFGGTHVSDPQEPRPRRPRGGGRAGFYPRPSPCAGGLDPPAQGRAVGGRRGGRRPRGVRGGG